MMSDSDLAREEQGPTVWPLRRFDRCDVMSLDTNISTRDCDIHLDRANAEFGLVYQLSDATMVVAQCDENKPVFFKAAQALALCQRSTRQGCAALKVSVLLPNHQIDMEFEYVDDAQSFGAALKGLATNALAIYDAPSIISFMKDSFRITQLPTYYEKPGIVRSIVHDRAEELSGLWGCDELSDLVVVTGTKSFNVHKTVLALRSQFFRNACKPGFKESASSSICLEEDASTVEALLMEIYGLENRVTGSVFTTFALEPAIKKEAAMGTLLSLFIAADKYGLDQIKKRAASAFIHRLIFIADAAYILDLANLTLDSVPERDYGLRSSVIRSVQSHLPTIMRDPEAVGELAQNTLVSMTILRSFSRMIEEGSLVLNPFATSSSGLETPPDSPCKKRKLT